MHANQKHTYSLLKILHRKTKTNIYSFLFFLKLRCQQFFSYANGKDDFQEPSGKTPQIKNIRHASHTARKGAKEGYLESTLQSYLAH